ncbi:GNAT family N-acetyltransferase [Uliginosibacterium sp. 31-16]|uniref:GNAT family N-acetyltransferase n=1 Tax=Uliginosibacterium sp. 31-16 TaxID=3068315 RepID=UPI0027402201|nr:GNAT family N-acetyltransferase [Uliginosibacterium sp. 31-16]MDP5238580.1 GNAT family N-acetyltransferase [Uliginosibacterium sp. 31-16]
MSLRIRPATEVSVATLYALFEGVYASTDGMCETLAEKFGGLPGFPAYLADIASRPGGRVLVAEDAGTLLGYLTLTPRRPAKLAHTADLSMGVRAAARGRGIGKALLAAAMTQASPPLEILYLMVRADNAAALRLYAAAGFETLARLEKDTRIGTQHHDGLLMRAWVGELRA